MVFSLINPTPFVPPGMQRVVVHGWSDMHRVVVVHVAQRNNDLASARLHLMQAEHVNFWDIQNIIEDCLHNHMNVGFHSMQPSPFG
jgi:hypothetical protein